MINLKRKKKVQYDTKAGASALVILSRRSVSGRQRGVHEPKLDVRRRHVSIVVQLAAFVGSVRHRDHHRDGVHIWMRGDHGVRNGGWRCGRGVQRGREEVAPESATGLRSCYCRAGCHGGGIKNHASRGLRSVQRLKIGRLDTWALEQEGTRTMISAQAVFSSPGATQSSLMTGGGRSSSSLLLGNA
jgi:hypothetical protein